MRFAVAALVLCTFTGGCTDRSAPTPDGMGAVVYVVDGDTIDVDLDGRTERIRLIGIDTPETKQPNAPVECYGPEAAAFTSELLPVGASVRIERDVVGRDDYGRLLGYVHLIGDDGGETFVNLEIVEQGFAQPLTIDPNSTFAPMFAAAARDAERSDLGLWGACSS